MESPLSTTRAWLQVGPVLFLSERNFPWVFLRLLLAGQPSVQAQVLISRVPVPSSLPKYKVYPPWGRELLTLNNFRLGVMNYIYLMHAAWRESWGSSLYSAWIKEILNTYWILLNWSAVLRHPATVEALLICLPTHWHDWSEANVLCASL